MTPERFVLLNSSQETPKGQNDSSVEHLVKGVSGSIYIRFLLNIVLQYTHSDANISTSLFFNSDGE